MKNTVIVLRKWVLAVLAAAVLIPALANEAAAEWDPQRFVKLQQEADEAFTSEDYKKAIPVYLDLKVMLETALDGDEIPAEQKEMAQQALGTIQYQLGRCMQLTDECTSSLASFKAVQSDVQVPPEVRVKLPVRLAEVSICLGETSFANNEMNPTVSALDDADRYIREAEEQPVEDVLAGEQAAELEADLEAVKKATADLSARTVETVVSNAESRAAAKECDEARLQLRMAEARTTPELQPRLDEARNAIVGVCGKQDGPAEPVSQVPVGPIVLTSIGAAILAGDLAYELVLNGTISDFDSAKEACDRGEPGACQEALDLADEIDTGRIISASLLGVGAATLISGVIWWILWEPDSVSETDSAASFYVVPTRDGGAAGMSVRF